MNTRILLIALLSICLSSCGQSGQELPNLTRPEGHWVSLFNGKDLNGWVPKIAGHELGDNYANTFRVERGVLKVAYDQYDQFGTQIGNLTFRQKFSRYWLHIEYRFVGDLAKGAPAWAFRDSGVQFHRQSPESMSKDQQFPVSLEVNFIGGKFLRKRPTGDVCTTGTHVVINGSMLKETCSKVSTITIHNDDWVSVDVEVLGHELVRQAVNGKLIVEYSQLQLNEADPEAARLIAAGASKNLSEGYISLQSNGHPVEFRKIELLNLVD